MKKIPFFQFYVKDWRSSPTVRSMSFKERGVYLELLIASWDTDRPGCLPDPSTISHASFERITGIRWRTFGNFLAKFPHTFRQADGWLINDRLYAQYVEYKEISDKRRDAANVRHHHANASDLHSGLHMPALALAPAKPKPLTAAAVLTPEQTAAAFSAIGFEKPFGDRRFQNIWVQEFGKPVEWVTMKMEATIQRLQAMNAGIPPQFYSAKHRIEKEEMAQFERQNKRAPL